MTKALIRRFIAITKHKSSGQTSKNTTVATLYPATSGASAGASAFNDDSLFRRFAVTTLFCLSAVLLCAVAKAAPSDEKQVVVDGKYIRAVEVLPKHLRLFWRATDNRPYGDFGSLKKALEKQGLAPRVMMNAGIYTLHDTPAGLHIEQGQVIQPLNIRKGKGNFHIQPNGVFYLTADKQPAIRTTASFVGKYGKAPGSLFLAVQSGPMLVINGKINPQFTPQGQSTYSRNGVCVSRDDRVWFLATASFVRSNMYTFAKAAKQLGCNNALYLDGNISKLYVRGRDSTFHFAHYVGILAEVYQGGESTH